MDYYVSLGVPAGCLGQDDAHLIILGDQMLSTDKLTYTVWSTFVSIRSITQAAEALQLSQQQVEQVLKLLLEDGLVIPVKDIMGCIAVRQGLGWGYDEGEQDCVINWGGAVHVPYTSYLIWCCCDGKTALEEILKLLREQGVEMEEELAHMAVHTLLRRNVLLLGR